MSNFALRVLPYLKATKRSPATSGEGRFDGPVTMPFVEGVVITYVVDTPHGLVFLQEQEINQAGITREELHLQAMSNLRTLSREKAQVHQHGPIYGVALDGNFEASLFLLKSFWQEDYAHLAKAGFAVCMPARDVLAFCDMDSQEGLVTLREMATRVADGGDHLLTPTIFRLRKGGSEAQS